jgi:hypothetical protein
MTHWNKDQWGAQQGQEYPPLHAKGGSGMPNPGYSQPYAQSVSQPQYNPQVSEAQKSPFEDGRFQPKKRINDIFFLIFFILQVSTRYFVVRSFSCCGSSWALSRFQESLSQVTPWITD